MTVARRPSPGPKPALPATAPRLQARAARPAQRPADLIGLQRSAGNRAVAQRFGSEEHRQLGDAGSGGAGVDLDIGDPAHPLTHGDLVALSGDYFGSPQEIMTLSGSENGKAQLRWARFEALHRGDPGPVGDDVKQAVKDRYYRLAAVNISHFAAGGTARTQYEQQHRSAMQIAFMAAATADRQQVTTGQVTEAFSQHFLTDMFSAGHIRTPRADIKAWYDGHLGNSVGRFVDYTAHWVTERLDAFGDIPFWCPNAQIQAGVTSKVRELGGSAVDSFSLGDIVSLAMHDRDNREGVWVLSDLDQSGAPVAGGYVWPEKAMGDNHLAESAITRLMAEQAVQASIRETQAAAVAGHALTAGACVPPERLEVALNQFMAKAGPPRALGFVPRADPQRTQAYVTAGAQAAAGELNYRWGALDEITRGEVDSNVKTFIAGKLASMSGSIGDADGVVYGANIADWLPGLGPEMVGHNMPLISLHVRKAFEEYCAHLRAEGIHVVEAAMGAPATGGGAGGAGGDLDAGLP